MKSIRPLRHAAFASQTTRGLKTPAGRATAKGRCYSGRTRAKARIKIACSLSLTSFRSGQACAAKRPPTLRQPRLKSRDCRGGKNRQPFSRKAANGIVPFGTGPLKSGGRCPAFGRLAASGRASMPGHFGRAVAAAPSPSVARFAGIVPATPNDVRSCPSRPSARIERAASPDMVGECQSRRPSRSEPTRKTPAIDTS